MAKRNAADVAHFLIDGYDILGTLTEVEDTREAVTEPTHTLGDAWEEHSYAGVRRAEITQKGFYDDDTASVHDALTSGIGAQSRVLTYAPGGTGVGSEFIGFEGALEIDYKRIFARGTLTKAEARYVADGAVDVGKVLRDLAPATASGATTGTPLDNAVSSTGGAGYFQYTSGGEAEVDILHSADNVTYAVLFDFACATAARGAQRMVTTAVIERYTAANYSTGGVTGTVSFRYFAGISRHRTSGAF